MFNERYTANNEFSIEKKQSWKLDVMNNRAGISTRLKKFNRKNAQNTDLVAEGRSEDTEDLLFNPTRCKDLMTQVYCLTFWSSRVSYL